MKIEERTPEKRPKKMGLPEVGGNLVKVKAACSSGTRGRQIKKAPSGFPVQVKKTLRGCQQGQMLRNYIFP
ncbi:MAG: hypothetical protein A2X25_06150 [Chloroflexi bacterium GWB2_49_20]|nr:MAG: hypothetical protein A2X25_06150 [Chloroflexi bacterium GWB2_49_20]OGN77201.1 MAG: hypothetical protein A2X26_07150 [Chloroflexi bacterium GWC2_49_37]OGN83927.1 MAG: hypothetical protein A2X27_02755 [Chloroflexi bacterium GWD2_49_16]